MKEFMMHFQMRNLRAKIEDKEILKGINLDVRGGEIHAIMGPNGSGKSTLSKAVTGHPSVTVTTGDIILNGERINDLLPEERALKGIFLSFQYPTEIPGVNNANFLRMAYNAKRKFQGLSEIDPFDFEELLQIKLNAMKIDEDFLSRSVNAGFSGGEKKRNEMLQMAVLEPQLAILDEVDSGLDIDALRIVSQGINQLRSSDKAIILITHYQRLLDYIEPDFVHVFANGQFLKSGDKSLALELEDKGYDWIIDA